MSSDASEINLNASNDARSNTPRDSILQKLPAKQKSIRDSSGYIRLWDCFNQVSQASLVFEIFESADPCDFNQVSEEGTVANELLCVALSMDATRFVTGGSDTIIKVYDLTTRLRLLNLKSGSRTYLTKECTHHTSRISALVYHPRGKNDQLYSHIFVSASWDQTIQIWDDRKVASLWHYYGPQVVGSDGLDIDGMQNIIVASSWVRSGVMLKMWKFADFSITGSSLAAKRKVLQNYSKPVNEVTLEGSDSTTQGYVARMGGEGRYIFYAGYGMNVLKVIDRESMSIVAGLTDLPNAVYSLDSCLDPRDKRRCLIVFTNAKNVYLASVQSRMNFLEVASA
ncbi:unnamed protein product [Hydatigera taeniaeformis]|uniref:WD_REPEATS_REGION domain-containing protein n=1 Tax=Hydatigena taeniaeformis TaxID=6205 RepID=A0A0R3WKC1_HYDTA|nr:unnamed protein product [Hydatigera taeniaeformis]